MVTSALAYAAFVALLGAERGVELLISRRNAAWAMARGGVEYGQGHFVWMKLLHTVFLLACVAEVLLWGRAFDPAIGWPMIGLALAAQGLRYWAVTSLGRRWNVRVIVLPGEPPVVGGPYRYLRHPNYLAVILEGLAVPLIHGAWATALAFTLLNGLLLRVRIRCEERALSSHNDYARHMGSRGRLIPGAAYEETTSETTGETTGETT